MYKDYTVSTDFIFIQNALYSKTCLQQNAGDYQFWFVINLTYLNDKGIYNMLCYKHKLIINVLAITVFYCTLNVWHSSFEKVVWEQTDEICLVFAGQCNSHHLFIPTDLSFTLYIYCRGRCMCTLYIFCKLSRIKNES